MLRTALLALLVLVLALPLALVTTIALMPAWSWLEASAGIESVGHSGPAGWCYVAVYLLFSAIGVATVIWQQKQRRRLSGA
ncbi:hypothetical protein [Hydrogenophaga sp. 5NK40-0174]|uniref:hypothetical protein n=1 Tax=Hydrogenophaga sp. 5NK40-0174 TaxID=3127649 RepID=UPI003104E239